MKNKFLLLVLALLLTIGLGFRGAIAQEADPASAETALGSAFTYQGYLTEGDRPAEGQYDFRLRLFDSLEGGVQVGSDLTLTAVAVEEGLFSVQLDFGAAAFSGQARWLEAAVRPTGSAAGYTALSPRQALTAAPYALYSHNADLLDGQQASAFAKADHNHLDETWVGAENTLVISGTFTDSAPLVLSNLAFGGDGIRIATAANDGMHVDSAGDNGVFVFSAEGDGVDIDSAGDDGVDVDSAGDNGVHVGSAGANGVFVFSAGDNGVNVYSAGADGVRVSSAGTPPASFNSDLSNGLEINGAEGFGVSVGETGSYGYHLHHARSDGLHINQADGTGVFIYSAGGTGVFVYSAGGSGIYANTTLTSGEWGLYTPDKIYASNLTFSSLTLIAQVADAISLSPGDLAAAVGMADPAPGSQTSQPLVTLADQASFTGAIGVVQSCMAYIAATPPEGESGEALLELHSVEGPCQPGSLVALTAFGVASVRVDPAVEIQPGMRLTVSGVAGAARPLRSESLNGMIVTEGAPVIGIALASPTAGSPIIPVFVTLH